MFFSLPLSLRLPPTLLAMAPQGWWFGGWGRCLCPSSPAMEGHPFPPLPPRPAISPQPGLGEPRPKHPRFSRMRAAFLLSSPLRAGGQGDGVMHEGMGGQKG